MGLPQAIGGHRVFVMHVYSKAHLSDIVVSPSSTAGASHPITSGRVYKHSCAVDRVHLLMDHNQHLGTDDLL